MDATKTRGVWLLPTYNRPTTNLPRFLKACVATGMSTPGAILVDEADYAKNHAAYDAIDMPDNWRVVPVLGGSCAEATREGFVELCDGMDWVGWLADDLVPETPGWDVRVIEALTGWNIVSTDDGRFAPRKFNGATAWSGDVLRAAGFLYPAGVKHFFIDTAWEDIATLLNNWTCLMDVMVRHVHAHYVGAADKTTAHTQSWWKEDETAFIDWKNKECFPAAERIGQVMVDYGVSKKLPDLTGIHVMLATPCGSGKYERWFVNSLIGTLQILRQCGAMVNFVELPYCSDVTLARNKLFGQFVRSGATHLMSIDDDMGWNPADVIRLLDYKRDFVAVAGPRKVFPPSFAVQNTDEAGRSMPMRSEGESGLFMVSDIGFAFSLITKALALRMINAYSDMEYETDDGRVDYGLYNPLIVNRRYRSEDFSFCYRWRQIGGKIYVDPTISLKHVGTFVWEGSWISQLLADANQPRVVAA